MLQRVPQLCWSLGRLAIAALLAGTMLAAALLSVAPAWHEYLHPDTTTSHLCVVTFFASGHCESTNAAPLAGAPAEPVLLATLTIPEVSGLPRTDFFARLEHAPPSLA